MRVRATVAIAVALAGCRGPVPPSDQPRSGSAPPLAEESSAPEALSRHCAQAIGLPRVERVGERIFVAIGFDLANTIVIQTSAGNVVVDASMSPARAQAVRAALAEHAPGPTAAVIYTHGHIDHIGGASVWVEEATPVWASARLADDVVAQYGRLRLSEVRRGARQFGHGLPESVLPCSGIGPRPDLDTTLDTGVRFPTHTFEGRRPLRFGDTEIELVEAPGETTDQLFVWLPAERALLCGDNFYHAFPNLYTIRGTRPRPVDGWIRSLDEMRRLDPEVLVPSHMGPVRGREAVRQALTDYRDAIQWVRDAALRGANRGEPIEALAPHAALPPHLASRPYLAEMYGQTDWSVRALYTQEVGWFDGRPELLYPLGSAEAAAREVGLMGGAESVLAEADRAAQAGEPRWAAHLLAKLRTAGSAGGATEADVVRRLGSAWRATAESVTNPNGRAYLLRAAREALGEAPPAPSAAMPDDELLSALPVGPLLEIMTTRLVPEGALDVHESVRLELTDTGEQWTLTVRRGVAEAARGQPLPGTPDPLAVLRCESLVWKGVMAATESPLGALGTGRLTIEGSRVGALRFFGRFER